MENYEYQEAKKQAVELERALEDLLKKQTELTGITKQNGDAYRLLSDQIEKVKKNIKAISEELTRSMQSLDNFSSSVQQNIALLGMLELAMGKLSQTHTSSATVVQQLQVNILSLSNTVNNQTTALNKSKEAFDFHKGSVDALDRSVDKLKDGAGEFAPVLGSVTTGFNAMKTGIEVVKTGFQGVGGAIRATGFGLLVLVLESVTEYLTKNEKGVKFLKSALAAIGVVVDKVKKVFEKIGGVIVSSLIYPGDAIKKLWTGIVDNFANRFTALGVILDGVFHLNPKKILDGTLQLTTGVTNLTDKVKNGFTKIKDEIITTGNDAANVFNKVYKEAGIALDNHTNKVIQNAKKQNAAGKQNSSSAKSRSAPGTSHDILLAKGTNLTEQFAKDKKLYDEELALLNEQLNKKAIAQEEYNLKSRQLQETYHQSIGATVKDFHKSDLDMALKHLQDISELNSRKKAIELDEQGLKKAFFPAQKFDAEKKLIDDKYAYELTKAQQAGQDTAAITEKYEQDKTALVKQYEQQRRDFALNTAQQVADKAFSIIGNNIKSSSDAKIKGLEKDKASELSNKNLTATQRKAIEDKYKKKEAEEKIKAFKAEQRASVVQAVVNGALAITKATAQTGVLAAFVIPGIIASTALQIATIIAQKPPAFAKGGRFVSDGRGALLPGYSRTDNTNAYLRSGEAVVVSEAMRNPWARNLVSAINVAHGGRDFSVPNMGKGYAVGGIFTDGGNANRYYNQPMNDVKDLANTLAYQMINNFPPIYVDVKDVNNQQNILAQTVNRVNL